MLIVDEGEDVYVTETIYNRETRLPVYQRMLLGGALQAPPDGSPSEIHFDELGRPAHFAWHDQDKHHRIDGPALLSINPDNDVHILEDFVINGKYRSPSDGPYRIVRDKDSGEITETFYDSIYHEPNPP